MTRPKQKKDPRAKYTLSDKQVRKIKADATAEAVKKTGLLYLAALAEKGWSEDEVVELFETVTRYARYLDEHVLQIREVQEVIKRKTGITIQWK